jgi:Arm DNA-binding domain
MPRPYNKLAQAAVISAMPGMHADGGGLYLRVTMGAGGQRNRSWLFRYAVGPRERQMGLGPLALVKLAEARQRAAECRRLRLEGIDPIDARDTARRPLLAICVSAIVGPQRNLRSNGLS